MSQQIKGVQEISFFRKMTAIGGVLLIAVSIINSLFPSELIDYPILRIGLAILALGLFAASFTSKFVQKNSDYLLAGLIYAHAITVVWSNYLNSFEIFDTSTSLVVGFSLGAAFRKKDALFGYLVLIAGAYSLFFFYSAAPQIPTDYFLITLGMLIVLAWMVFSSRITALDQLEKSQEGLMQSEATFRNIFEWAPVGIVLLDMNFNAFRVNQIILNHTGYEEEHFVGSDLKKWIHAADEEEYEKIREKIKANRNISLEQRIKKQDGQYIWARLNLAKMRSPLMGEYILVMVEDITFQKKASEKLKEYATKLKQHNKALEDFSYVVSHDLQEPLRMIKSYTQIINRRYIEKLHNEDASKDMYYVIDGAERMSTLIRDMLSYTRMSARSLDKESVPTAEVVYDVLQNLTISIKERKASIYIEELPEVQSNRVLFGQIIQNLIGNGLKYCSVDRYPKIEVSAKANQNETIFCIKDNGVGFSEEEGKKIFGIFQRINSTAGREKGTGIGLAICQRIVNKHGGKIWAEGVPGEGARFYFTLPN